MSEARSSIPSRRHGFPFGGELARRIEALDGDTSPLGPIDGWSTSLRSVVGTMLAAGAEIVLFWGPDFAALYNDAYAPTIGAKHPAVLGRPAREGWAELWDDLGPLLCKVRDTGETFSAKDRPFYLERAGHGETVYFDVSYSPVLDDDGRIGGVLCIVSETTARVRAAQSMVAEKQRLAQMFEQAPSFIAVLRHPGHVFELVNTSYLQLVGHRDLIGRTFGDILPELAEQGYVELLDTVVATGKPHRDFGARVSLQRAPNGGIEERFVDFVFQPITDATGKVSAIFVEGNDVTDRMRAEARFVASEQSLRLATDTAGIGTWDFNLIDGKVTWSERARILFGVPVDSPVNREVFQAGIHPDDRGAVAAAFDAMIDPDRRSFYDVEYRTIGREDGVLRWVSSRGRGMFDGRRCVRAAGTIADITQRRLVEAGLRESEQRFRLLADTAPALIWVTDASGDVTFANRAFETMLGVPAASILGTGWRQIIEPVSMNRFSEPRFKARESWSADIAVRGADARPRWVHMEASPRIVDGVFQGYIGCAIDVTEAHLAGEALERAIADRTAELVSQIEEREKVEATLHQMQRLEAVGQLTSGVAHDFNNLLTVVIGNVGMVERSAIDAAMDPRTLRRLESIRTAAERGAKLTAQLLAFSRRQRLEAKATNLNATAAGMQDMVRTSLGNAITIEMRLAEGLWLALVDPVQIELIILNLAINARDAMEVGGTLTIETANVHRGPPEAPEDPPAGDHIMVAVADDGSGMTPDVLAKAFEPFFTTKPVGRGSGLGLAQVFGFAKQSGGGVRIETELGRGTRVCVYLPRSDVPVPAAEADDAPDATTSLPTNITILVVDDDDDVRSVTADTVRQMGCRVVEANSGDAALEALKAEAAIALIVADFAMPGMNGAELARHVKVLRPGLPFIVLTGYADIGAIADVPDDSIVQKPFTSEDLAARIAAALAR